MFIKALRRVRQDEVPSPEDLSAISERLEGAPPIEILEWATETYGDGLALSASFGGPEGMALLDMLSRITDDVTVLTIDTGFLFRETIEFREEVMRRYKLPLVVLRPALSIEEQVERHGEKMRTCSPDLCCQIRKIQPLQRALERYDAWMTGIRREQTPARAAAGVVERDPPESEHAGDLLGAALRSCQDRTVRLRQGGVGSRVCRRARRSRQPAARKGLQEHRLRTADPPGGAGRGRSGRTLVAPGEDRVRPSLGRRAGGTCSFLGNRS